MADSIGISRGLLAGVGSFLLCISRTLYAGELSSDTLLQKVPLESSLQISHEYTVRLDHSTVSFDLAFFDGQANEGDSYGGRVIHTTSPISLGASSTSDAGSSKSAQIGSCMLFDETVAYQPTTDEKGESILTIKAGHVFTVRGYKAESDNKLILCNESVCARGRLPLLECQRSDRKPLTLGDLKRITGGELKVIFERTSFIPLKDLRN